MCVNLCENDTKNSVNDLIHVTLFKTAQCGLQNQMEKQANLAFFVIARFITKLTSCVCNLLLALSSINHI